LSWAGWVIATLAGERAFGMSAIERALALNPNSALAWNFNGWLQGFSNRPAPAIEALQRAIRLSPLDARRWMFWGGLALAHLIAGRYEKAIEWANQHCTNIQWRCTSSACRAVACSRLDRIEEGRECIRRFCELRPGSTVTGVEGAMRTVLSPEVLAIYAEGLRRAGLPEG
jgi:adenylate cyclase